jgi:hypothetical protein
MNKINIPSPDEQIAFSFKLGEARAKYLQDGLSATVGNFDQSEFEKLEYQIRKLAPIEGIRELAKRAIRTEIMFATPLVLESNPFLLGYYRLLLGFSQKVFYTSNFGLTSFKALEHDGRIPKACEDRLEELCLQINASAMQLLGGVGPARMNKDFIDDLTLLTLGPQFRGGRNNEVGQNGAAIVFKEILHIVKHAADNSDNSSSIKIKNSSKRDVEIAFSSDPDIVMKEAMDGGESHNLIAIEIKAGKDPSNIHNRIGEAEKSHQKARQNGFTECWTIINVSTTDMELAKKESPSTNQFFLIEDIVSRKGDRYKYFKNRIIGLAGIRSK